MVHYLDRYVVLSVVWAVLGRQYYWSKSISVTILSLIHCYIPIKGLRPFTGIKYQCEVRDVNHDFFLEPCFNASTVMHYIQMTVSFNV